MAVIESYEICFLPREINHGLGINFKIVPKLSIEDGIQAVRSILNRCWWDITRCDHGIECLKNYRRQYDDKRKCYFDHPYHDWSSHGSDAFRYLALVAHGIASDQPEEGKIVVATPNMCLEELFKFRERQMRMMRYRNG